ncbi:MAG TPA: sigma-70 family RNA polymerase sigma factor [Chitinophagaceae bacterium]|jgi:RNA polymerase sigma factor (sigma-70 family)|nr:sigma-70 family RNA polymerase sigma factor [Chitinophagaceae bacterium]
MMQENETLKQLFQKEFSKIVAVISKQFGLQHIEIAEDIVSETFLQALETWKNKGTPANPTAWIYKVAQRKTLYHFRRGKIFEQKIVPNLKSTQEKNDEISSLDFSPQNIKDSQLQMLFAVCNPTIAGEAQIGLALRILCGFSIDEIAEAFLSNEETIKKRLFRAKEKLRASKVKMELPPEKEIEQRLDNVLHIIYLLFTEGYYSKTQNEVLRKDFCLEAMRLCLQLTDYKKTNLPKTNALLALMCFHSSRFRARLASDDTYILYENQNQELWDPALIKQGTHFLLLSATGNDLSSYHVEARIASLHCQKEDSKKKWEKILHLYNQLLFLNYSPAVALNRTFALYKVYGAQAALAEAEKLKLDSNYYYFILMGELYKNIDHKNAKANFLKAYSLARTITDKQALQTKIDSLL